MTANYRKALTSILSALLFSLSALSYAGTPVWTFTALTPTTLSVPGNETATVQYKVTNQSSRSHTLEMTPITGITQITTGVGICGNPFTLSSKGDFCTLSLQVNGSQLTDPISDGPIVCQQGSNLECYRPHSRDILNITTPTNAYQYTVGGTVSGLAGTLTLLNNGSDALTTSTDGNVTFTTPITDGGTYAVTVQSQPSTQTCTVNNASGTIHGANVTNVSTTCATNAYTVGGTVSGLSGTVVLRNNGTNATSISSNGSFTFSTPIAQGSTYAVTVQTQPSTQTCTVSNGTGTMGGTDVTNVSVTCSTNEYTVGGTISGLTGTLTLLNNGSDALTTSTDGNFTFTTPITDGSTYAVTVQTQPSTQTCTVNNASGTINGANVTNVSVTCATNAYTVGGTVSGLSGTVVLRNNGTNATSISSNGSFTFSTSIAQGSTYAVTVQTQPSTQTCTVSNGTGTMGGANVTNVSVTCSTNTHTVGGTVSGLSGTVILLNNGGDNKTVSSNGSFTFSTPVAQGSTYAVTVGTQPALQTCSVSNGSGTMGSTNVTNVGVTCVTNNTTLTVSPTGIIPVYSGAGAPGTLTVTNTGVNIAHNVAASLPGGWIGVTQDASDCVTIAANGGTCTLKFTSTTPYIAQAAIPVTGNNITAPPTTALAFTVDDYLVWAIFGSTVQVTATSDAIGSPQLWSTTNDDIPGITQTSFEPPCNGGTDGACNTAVIVDFYPATPTTDYAAGLCYGITSDNTGSVPAGTWYLPAICQMGPSLGTGCGVGASLYTSLAQYGFGNFSGNYWSSTEVSFDSTNFAWYQEFLSGSISQQGASKDNTFGVRCSRALSL
jgi:multisubunit Na+/H+ antiporter MnhB subunit